MAKLLPTRVSILLIYLSLRLMFFCYQYLPHEKLSDRYNVNQQIIKNIKQSRKSLKSPNGQACKHPVLDIYNAQLMRFFKATDPIVCDEEMNWIEIEGSVAKITAAAKETHGKVECTFTDIIMCPFLFLRISTHYALFINVVIPPLSTTNSHRYHANYLPRSYKLH